MSDGLLVDLATIVAGVLIALITGYFGWKGTQSEKGKRSKAEREVVIANRKFNLAVKHRTYESTREDIQSLMSCSCIERYLMLVAHNGKDSPVLATAIVQLREKGEHNIMYQDFRLDRHYKDLLAQLKKNKWLYLRVSEMPHDSRIRNIYEFVENVTATFWGLVSVETVVNDIVEYTYITLSTRDPSGEIDGPTIERCKLILDRLRAQAATD